MTAEPYLDSRRSMLVAAACSWCLFWAVIVNRSSGIVFVTMISEMDATREAASWPFSLLGAVSNIFGVLSGILLRKLPLRAVSVLGSAFVAAGILLTVAFYGVMGITLCVGTTTSIGQGMIFPANMLAINIYFKKCRASGSGISYMGGTLSSFIFPPVLVYTNDKYRLRGTLLIVGGLSLNALAGSLLIAKPQGTGKKGAEEEAAVEAKPLKQAEEVEEAPDKKEGLREELSFMRRPIYYVIVLSGMVFAYSLVMFVVTIVDHGMGKSRSKLEAATLLSCYGGGELVGRICSGMLSDKKLCHRRDIMAMGYFLMSLSFVGLVYADSMVALGAASVLFGLTSGSIMILFSVLLMEYFGLKKLPMAIGIYFLVNGLSALPRPLVIGYYRDRGSSYDGMYMLLAIVSLTTSFLWAIECFVKWRAEKIQADHPSDRKPDAESAT